jgi:ABC-2 type transport system ATP-binding protein
MAIIEINNLQKVYRSGVFKKRETRALQGVTLHIEQGEIFGVLGPNGAGKTTLMNILMGLLIADGGTATVAGMDITKKFPMALKRRMNMCSGNPNLPWSLNVVEMMKFYAMLYGMTGKEAKKKIDELIHETGMDKYADTRFDELSTGNKQKLALAKSLLNDPEILLLDEPTLGLDPDISQKTRAFIKKIHDTKKVTILLTSHYMKEVEELAGRVAFIKDGKIAALGTKEELIKNSNSKDLEGMFIELANQQD